MHIQHGRPPGLDIQPLTQPRRQGTSQCGSRCFAAVLVPREAVLHPGNHEPPRYARRGCLHGCLEPRQPVGCQRRRRRGGQGVCAVEPAATALRRGKAEYYGAAATHATALGDTLPGNGLQRGTAPHPLAKEKQIGGGLMDAVSLFFGFVQERVRIGSVVVEDEARGGSGYIHMMILTRRCGSPGDGAGERGPARPS